jgi:hypothetical protein
MNAKLFLQILLALGCLALAIGVVEAVTLQRWIASGVGWWRGAMACWMLIVAIRMIYPAHAK